jgi:excisionase family DNA binding protein
MENRQVFDVESAAEYLRTLGFEEATKNTIRKLIAQKRLACTSVGRKFYVSRAALDGLVEGLNRPISRGRFGAAA